MDEHDQHDLRLLALLHYVLGGVTAAFMLPLLPLVWICYRSFNDFTEAAAQPAVTSPGDITAWGLTSAVGLAASVSLAVLCPVHGALLAYIGRSIARRRRRLLCLVFSGLHAINVPFGTALSVFTFIVLRRPSVKEAFS
jgi:hypothetical protein